MHTIEVVGKPLPSSKTVISDLEHKLMQLGINAPAVKKTALYTVTGNKKLEKRLSDVASLVHHDFTEKALIDKEIEAADWDFAIKVDKKPGVTDNPARVLQRSLPKKLKLQAYSSDVYYIKGDLSGIDIEQLKRVYSNPQINDVTILSRNEFLDNNGFEKKIHPVLLGNRPDYFWLNLSQMDEAELEKTGRLGTLNLKFVKGLTTEETDKIRGGTLALVNKNYGLDYMHAIQAYSESKLNTKIGRKKGKITDTELEVLAQMWSEHCRHSLFNASVPESKEGIFSHYIKNPTLEVLAKKPHLGVSIFKDNSGVFSFNEKWNICIKNETHNSPSALDPYGGAITGIVGVNRDPMGTGMGAEVILNFWSNFVGLQNNNQSFYKSKSSDGTLSGLILNPLQIQTGTSKGVEDGGNQMGIPILLADFNYNERNNGKPTVVVGSVGRMPKTVNGIESYKKHIDVGDKLYIIGGRAGMDGIHGATFSSEGLTSNSPATAVQIGDPYTQRKLSEALLELRDKGYIKFVTDLGAGGVACASLEMAEETGGLEMNLDKLLFKYPGMTATEALLNESQERMAIAIDKKHRKKIEKILKKHDVEFSDVGIFTDSGRAEISYKGDTVVNLDMDFIHHGFPKRELKPAEYRMSDAEIKTINDGLDLSLKKARRSKNYTLKTFKEMIARSNLGSVAPHLDRMDSTVKGLSVQHCIQGKGRVSTKACAFVPDTSSSEGLILSYGHAERQSYIDSEQMGINSFLRSIGNNIAMGGRLDYMIGTDQFVWQKSDDPKYQQMLIEANRGMASVIRGFEVPVISGKDSMYNQATVYDKNGNKIERGVFPMLFMTTIAKIDDVSKIVTADVKQKGDLIYVVGAKTKADMGGSEFNNMWSEKDGIEYHVGNVSREKSEDVLDTYKRMNVAQLNGLLQSAQYIGDGGLALALKDAAVAGMKGIEADFSKVHKDNSITNNDELMYSVTEGRFLVTVKAENKDQFEKMFKNKISRIGIVNGKESLTFKDGRDELMDVSLKEMVESYHGMN